VAPVRILHVGDDFAALRPCGLTFYSQALMQAQAARGHEVAYFFSGRHYPLLRKARMRRWRSGRVRMLELLNSPINSHWETGTRRPEADLSEVEGETAFDDAVGAAEPQLVHVHELGKLPSSVLERAKSAGLPVVMTLHDYKPVCASVRLLDADGLRCERHDVGEDCARNCAGAPQGRSHLIDATLRHDLAPLRRRLLRAGMPRVDRLVERGIERTAGQEPPGPAKAAAAAGYQRRREENLRRLGLCDALVAPSRRAAAVYSSLGVDQGKIRVQRLTLPHLGALVARREPGTRSPLTFVTLGGCASRAKGSSLMVEAVRALERSGRGADYRLLVLGHIDAAAREALSGFSSVRLGGGYEPEELDDLLDAADVGLMPSIWEETHGFVGIEMLAKGLPVIGNAVGGIPEYVRDGETGWLNRSLTADGFAQLMLAAIADPSQVVRLQRSVRARRSELVRPMSDHAAEVESLYAELTRP
jgi:glycosyltransferase involved in cell wall biosynthesis